jgi:hypothetical protein
MRLMNSACQGGIPAFRHRVALAAGCGEITGNAEVIGRPSDQYRQNASRRSQGLSGVGGRIGPEDYFRVADHPEVGRLGADIDFTKISAFGRTLI